MERLLSEAREQYGIADQIYGLRTAAGLTQEELAKLTGTTRSVISRLEAAEYAGHSVSMLNRVASALGHRVEVRFVPLEKVETG